MKWLIYNLLFLPVFALMLPAFLLRMLRRGGYRARMLDRFALYPEGLFAPLPEGEAFVWIHAVSVGEVQVAGQLMREWRAAEPNVRFCFSTTSSTGWKMAEREVTDRDVLIYNPLDFPTFVKAALATIRPRAIVLTESEIWPNFVRRAKKEGVPVFLVNARVSDRSAPRYKAARFLFRDVFSCMTKIYAQSELDRSRLEAAGASASSIQVTGSFKFDVARRNEAKEKELREWLEESGEFPKDNRILLGGSTWPGEDEVLLRILPRLERVTLVIAPRHFEKADAVEANILAAGFSSYRRSRGTKIEPSAPSRGTVFLADTTGELMGLYGIADAVFVGKSLAAHGSQNMIEPCLCGKPTVVGPYTENFRPVMSDLLEQEGILQVESEEALASSIAEWFSSGDSGLGARAQKAVVSRRGVVSRCLESIRSEMKGGAPAKKPRPFSVWKTLMASVVFVLVLTIAAGAILFFFGPNTRTPSISKPAKSDIPRPQFVRTAAVFVSAIMKPEAKKAFVPEDKDGRFKSIFSSLSMKVFSEDAAGDLKFDIVFVPQGVADERAAEYAKRVSAKGVYARMIDVEGMPAFKFKSLVESFPCKNLHLWMITRTDWMLVARASDRKLKLGEVLGFFSRNGTTSIEVEEAGAGSIQGVFANYVGSRKEIEPAFLNGDLSVSVLPEHFVLKDVPSLSWIEPDELDPDIVDSIASAIRETMSVRRTIVSAEVRSRAKDGGERALRMWAGAMRRNPHDTMLLDRLYRLAVNARAFKDLGRPADAAYCYETMIAINPSDIRVIEEYAALLQQLGKRNLAAEVLRKVRELKSGGKKAEGGQRYDI